MKSTVKFWGSLFLCVALLLPMAACGNAEEEPSSSTVSEGSSAVSEPYSGDFSQGVKEDMALLTDKMPYLTSPKATGDFIQRWMCSGWPESRWESHFEILKQAGYEFIILQDTFDIANGKISGVSFPCNFIDDKTICAETVKITRDMLDNVFQAARKTDFKVMIGLGFDDDWWKGGTGETWFQNQAKLNNLGAKTIYDLYYREYGDLFYGWYWTYEMWTQKALNEESWAEMINLTRDYLATLTPDLPVMFCPFISKGEGLTPEENGALWERFFKKAHLQDGDIFCPQDSFGSSGQQLDYIERHHMAMRKAKECANAKVEYWLDVENFTDKGTSASVGRFTRQLDICSKLGTGLVSFSYSHYYDPQQKSAKFHKQYVKYLETIQDLQIQE